MKIMQSISILALFMGLTFIACKKDNDTTPQSEQLVASEDQTAANDLYEDVDEQVDEAIETRGGGTPICPAITIEPADRSYPRTMTVDYGTEGCEGPNGHIRKGKIIVMLTDTLLQEGAVRQVSFEDFYVDDVKIEGVRTIINEGFDGNGNLTLSRTVVGGKITFPDGDIASWDANHVMTQTEGGNTQALLDNVWEISGGATGVNRNGKAFTTEIVQVLVKKRACIWVVSGTKTLTVEDKTVSIDYGNGVCDRKATVTLPNGTVREILIRWWM